MDRRLGLVLAGVVGFWMAGVCSAHPQDGPHADVEITITEQNVTFDMLINLVMIDEMTPVPRENPGDVHPLEEPAIERALVGYIAREHRVAIDGVEVAPVVGSFEFIRPDVSNVVLFPRTGMRGLLKVHLVLEYPTKGAPASVAMRWGAYPPDYSLEADEDGVRPAIRLEARLRAEGRLSIVTFTKDEPEFVWHATGLTEEDRFAKVPQLGRLEGGKASVRVVPMVSAGLVGLALVAMLMGVLGVIRSGRRRGFAVAAVLSGVLLVGAYGARGVARVEVLRKVTMAREVSEADALAVFRPLHANIYRAFDETDRSAIYDALAQSVDGDLLDGLFNQIYTSLVLYEAGGAVSKVQEVTPIETTVISIGRLGEDGSPGFTVDARWRVKGMVYHWGHSHTRVNEYRARYMVVHRPQGWRIASNTIIEQFRVDSSSTDPSAPENQTQRVGEL